MRTTLILSSAAVLGMTGLAQAEVPRVVADIPPVHSLVAMVMQGVGAPDLLVPPGASPHGYAMRPSEAVALDRADAVFWMGEGLTPWLGKSLEALAADAQVVELAEAEGTTVLGFRDGVTFEVIGDAHGDEHAHDDDHGDELAHDDDHADHAEDDHADHDDHDDDGHGHDDHDEAAQAHDDHDHSGDDPHAWLDPENARVWVGVIADTLSGLDPENAATYAANATQARADLNGLIDEIEAQLEPVRDTKYVVFHDAYQYFENRFDIAAAGAISIADASDPSPARIAEIQAEIQSQKISCAFSEPQFNPALVETVFAGIDAKAGVMDPIGADLTPGAALYPQLLQGLSGSLVDCLE
ncbi:zinc ABC transporter substrate-binding protein [Pseudooceanicola sp. MF1-13]|uniref:zinc ABC transporter substrate-binding protein n=1 Tax=Pseudooceanicola sp. MF1-13 TaxID=3379095 RepID=UPI0038915F7E